MKITRLLCGTAVAAATIIGSQAFAASPSDAEAAYAVAGLKRVGPRLIDECGTAVTPSLRTVSLGGSVGDATVLQIEDGGCYGASAGSRIIILKSEGGQLRPIFDNDAGGFRVLPGRHLGVSDIELVVGGGVPIWRWNGRAYEFWKQAR